MRPLTGPVRKSDRQMMGLASVRQRRSPPKGMYINHDDLQILASADPQEGNVALQGLEKDVLELKCRVQTTKQTLESLKSKLPKDGLQSLLSDNAPQNSRINARWSQEELLMAAQGVRRYGRNFQKIAEVMGTKSEAHLKSFYANYRRRYNLDSLAKEHELETEQLEEMMADNNNDASASNTEGYGLSTRNSSSRRLEFS